MMNTIVLGLDGSQGSGRAAALALDLAKESDARIIAVQTEEQVATRGGVAPRRLDEEEMDDKVESAVEKLAAQGIEVNLEGASVMLEGPAHAIAEIANQADADLIVVGTRGRSGVAGLLLGSVTTRLLHIAKRPILAVPQVG